MMNRRNLLLGLVLFGWLAPLPAQDRLPGVEARVEAMLSRMTVEEKVGQLEQYSGQVKGKALDDVIAATRAGKVGSFFDVHGAKAVNELQKAAVEGSRLKIPALFGYDVIHGYRTIVPVPLGTAASWDPPAVQRGAEIAAREARAAGVRWTFAPMLDIARDPRWGRMVEGAGEDPYLGAAMARAQVLGFQGNDPGADGRVVACAKHWVAYGAVIGGRDYNSAEVSERTLRTLYFPPFRAARDAGVATFMTALNAIDGVPATANPFTLGTVLRGEWGFDGLVVADFKAVEQLIPHGVAATPSEAARLAVNSGVDMEESSHLFGEHLAAEVQSKNVAMDRLDQAVRRVLRLKYRLGLFENPYVDESKEAGAMVTAASRQVAHDLAARSLVLLKNDGGLLPIAAKTKSIALIGPFADDKTTLLGPWHGAGQADDVVTLLAGFRQAAQRRGDDVKITHAEGCKPQGDATDGIAAAVKLARASEIAIVVVGDPWTMSGEATSRSTLDLPGKQSELVKAVQGSGTPTVVVLLNGRALSVAEIADQVPAILEAWFPGVEGGPAIAAALFGEVNPAGKLPITFPRSVGEVPMYYNHLHTGRPPAQDDKYTSKYIDQPLGPLFPFGHGLSYTQFKIGVPILSEHEIRSDGEISVAVEVKNVGDRPGDEVVQIYLHDVAASVARPVRELCGFERVSLKPGEVRTLRFKLGRQALGFYNQAMKFVVEPGTFEIFAGSSSAGGEKRTFEVRD